MKRTIAASIGLISATLAHAQTAPSDVDAAQRRAQQIQQQQEQQLRRDLEAATPAPPRVTAPELGLPPLPAVEPGPCVKADKVVIEGSEWLSRDVRELVTTRYVNPCLQRSALQEALTLMTQDLMVRGLITSRVYLPEQDTATGELRFKVVEGRIERVVFDSATRMAHAFPIQAGDVLNLRDIEQGIEQMNRLPTNRATMDILPGSAAGLSVVRITNKPEGRVRGSLSLDNQGATSTGEHQWGGTIAVDNLLSLQDLLSLNYKQSTDLDVDRKGSRSAGLNWSLPLGYHTVSYTFTTSEYASSFTAPSGLTLLSDGTSWSHQIKLDRLLWRNQTSRVNASGGFTLKESRNFLERQYLAVSSRTLSVASLDLNASTLAGGWMIDGGVGADLGMHALGSQKDRDNLPDWAPRAQFQRYRATLNLSKPFELAGQNMMWSTQWNGQYGADVLYGSEQMSIGGLYSVRGFVRNSLAGDSGHYVRNELSLRKPLVLPNGQVHQLKLALGHDIGRVFSRVDQVPEGVLSGWFASLNLYAGPFQIELMHTKALNQPDRWFTQLESGQTWFRLNWAF